MLWDPFLYCINDSIQGNSETGNKVFVLPSKVAINNAVTRLRKKACQIPDPVGKANTLDLTSHKQDVVQIAIEPESSPAGLIPDNGNRPMHLDNSHTIEIEADGLLIRMSNEIKPLLLKMLMDTLKESLC